MIYIVTRHMRYYPMGGTDDWQLVTTDEQEAKVTLDALEMRDGDYALLIRIQDDGDHSTIDSRPRWNELSDGA